MPHGSAFPTRLSPVVAFDGPAFFTVDLTDYDFLDVDVKRLDTCDRCWPLMALAMRVLTTSLRDDFGFEHLLWVYSGRRGIHCWVCDTSARVIGGYLSTALERAANGHYEQQRGASRGSTRHDHEARASATGWTLRRPTLSAVLEFLPHHSRFWNLEHIKGVLTEAELDRMQTGCDDASVASVRSAVLGIWCARATNAMVCPAAAFHPLLWPSLP